MSGVTPAICCDRWRSASTVEPSAVVAPSPLAGTFAPGLPPAWAAVGAAGDGDAIPSQGRSRAGCPPPWRAAWRRCRIASICMSGVAMPYPQKLNRDAADLIQMYYTNPQMQPVARSFVKNTTAYRRQPHGHPCLWAGALPDSGRCTGPVYWSEPLEICHTVTTPTVVGWRSFTAPAVGAGCRYRAQPWGSGLSRDRCLTPMGLYRPKQLP
jgi:hypothetical protein